MKKSKFSHEFRPIHSPKDGALLSIEAYAGRIHGRKMRRRFKLSVYGDERWVRKAAETWIREVREQQFDNQQTFTDLSPRQRDDVIEAFKLIEPYKLNLFDVVRQYMANVEKYKLAEPWTFRQAANAVLDFKQANKKSAHYLRGLKGYLSTISLALGERICDDIKVEHLEEFLRSMLSF